MNLDFSEEQKMLRAAARDFLASECPKNKVRENLDAEIFDICLNEAKENKHKIIVLDTTKGIKTKLGTLLKIVK